MYGAIAGDIIGSVKEWATLERKPMIGDKDYDFQLFGENCDYTDDTVLTLATMFAIISDGNYAKAYKEYGCNNFNRGFGPSFRKWLTKDAEKVSPPYGSWGNGSAMRVSPIGWAFDSYNEVMDEAKKSAECTHDHPEGIKGAQAVALAIFLARVGNTKQQIKEQITREFEYDLNRTCDEIRPDYKFHVSCMKSVPEAIICFLDSKDYEDAVRLAVSLGGDADTQAAITGSIAEAFYKEIPVNIIEVVNEKIDKDMVSMLRMFYEEETETKVKYV